MLEQLDPYDWREAFNAAFIARACNAHDDMLAALKAVVDAGDKYWSDDFHIARCLAKAAIAKAEGR